MLAYLTAYDGMGIFEAATCIENIAMPKIVDKGALRKCLSFCSDSEPVSEAKAP